MYSLQGLLTPAVTDLDADGVARLMQGVWYLPSIPDGIADDDENTETEDNPNANGAAGDRLGSIENLTGSSQKDSLTGDDNPNVLKGMGEADKLNGGGRQ